MVPANKTGDNITIGTTNSAEDATTLFGVIGSNGFGGGYVLGATHSRGLDSVMAIRADSQYIGVYGSSQEFIGVYGSSEERIGVYGIGPLFAGYFNGNVYVSGTLTARWWHRRRISSIGTEC